MNDPGRLMGIDYGEVRIGIALCDPLQTVARPLTIVTHSSQHRDFGAIKRVAETNGVVRLVIGLPTDSAGGLGRQAQAVVRWARKLATTVPLPIVMWDETNSSVAAAQIRRTNRRKCGSRALDSVAAAVVLQDYLAALAGVTYEPGKPLEAFEDLV